MNTHAVRDVPQMQHNALQVDDLSVSFGGVHAVDGVSIHVAPGEIVGLIGTNGAGKTTLMDCVSGFVSPSAGRIQVFGQHVEHTAPEIRPYLGLGRQFQNARLFPGLTVRETLMVACERHAPTSLVLGMIGLGRVAERAKAEAVDRLMESTGLTFHADKRTGDLSTGTRRIVELACILAQRPKMLLLDEPTAGVAQKETEAFGPLLRRLQERIGCAILIIEHDMPLIMSLSNRLYAMESGRVIASGSPEEVRDDPQVLASYLGTQQEAINRSDHAGVG